MQLKSRSALIPILCIITATNAFGYSGTLVDQADGLRISRATINRGGLNLNAADDSLYINTYYTTDVVQNVGNGILYKVDDNHVDASFAKFNGEVTSSTGDGHGGYYVGGYFNRVNGISMPYLAHVFKDGSLDPAFKVDSVNPVLGLKRYDQQLYFYTKNSLKKVNLQTKSIDPYFHVSLSGECIIDQMYVSGHSIYISGGNLTVNKKYVDGFVRLSTNTGEFLPYFAPPSNGILHVQVFNNVMYTVSYDTLYEISANNGRLLKRLYVDSLSQNNSPKCQQIYHDPLFYIDSSWMYLFDRNIDGYYTNECVFRYRLPDLTMDVNFNIGQKNYFTQDELDQPKVFFNKDSLYILNTTTVNLDGHYVSSIVKANKNTMQLDTNFVKNLSELVPNTYVSVNTLSIDANHLFLGGLIDRVIDTKLNVRDATLLKFNLHDRRFDPSYVVHGGGRNDLMSVSDGAVYTSQYISPGHYDIVKRMLNSTNPLNFSLEKSFSRPMFAMLVRGSYIYIVGSMRDPILNPLNGTHLYRFDAHSGKLDRSFRPNLDATPIRLVIKNDALFVVEIGGRRLLKLNLSDGKVDDQFNPILPESALSIDSISVYKNTLYYSVASSNRLYAVDVNTGQSILPTSGLIMTSNVKSINPSGHYLYVGTTNGVQRIDLDNMTLDKRFFIATDDSVYSVVQDGNRLVLYGQFTLCNDQIRNGIAIVKDIDNVI